MPVMNVLMVLTLIVQNVRMVISMKLPIQLVYKLVLVIVNLKMVLQEFVKIVMPIVKVVLKREKLIVYPVILVVVYPFYLLMVLYHNVRLVVVMVILPMPKVYAKNVITLVKFALVQLKKIVLNAQIIITSIQEQKLLKMVHLPLLNLVFQFVLLVYTVLML